MSNLGNYFEYYHNNIYLYYFYKKAKNEPDTYETPDITFSYNNKTEMLEEDSQNIHKINVTVKDAHSKFNKSSLNNTLAG